MSFYKWFNNTKFIKWGFNQNWAIWFHMLGGGVGAWIGKHFFSDWVTLSIIIFLAVVWEGIEFIADGGIEGMIKIYGTLEKWEYDSLGDVVGALIIASLVIF